MFMFLPEVAISAPSSSTVKIHTVTLLLGTMILGILLTSVIVGVRSEPSCISFAFHLSIGLFHHPVKPHLSESASIHSDTSQQLLL